MTKSFPRGMIATLVIACFPLFTFAQSSAEAEAITLARQAMDLRYDRLDVSLHLMSRALQTNNSSEVRELATELLALTAYDFEEEWSYEVGSVRGLAISQDQSMIAVGDDYGGIYLLDAEGNLLDEIEAHDNTIATLAFSPDGAFLAAGSYDNHFTLWKISDNSLDLDARHYYGNDWVRDLTFSPSGEELFVAGDVYYSLVYNLATREVTDTLPDHDYYIYAIDINDAGTVVASGDGEGLLKVWTKEEGAWKEAGKQYLETQINDLDFGEGNDLYAGLSMGYLLQLDLSDPSDISVETITENGEQEFTAIAVTDELLVAGGDGSRIEFWVGEKYGVAMTSDYIYELAPFGEEKILMGSGDAVSLGAPAFIETQSTDQLKAGEDLPELSLEDKLTYNLWTPEEVASLSTEERITMYDAIAVIAQSYYWAYTDVNALSDLFTTEALSDITLFLNADESLSDDDRSGLLSSIIRSVGAIPETFGQALLQKGKAAEVLSWLSIAGNTDFSTDMRKYAGRRVYAIAPSPEMAKLVAAGLSTSMASIEIPDEELAFGCDANSVSYSPDGAYLFVTTDRAEDCDGGYLYPTESGGMPIESRGMSYPHQSNIMWQGSFSSDGQRIASASTDGTAIIYNLNGGTEHIFVNEGGEVPFTDARILRNGDVITTDNQGLVLQWSMGGIVPDDVLAEHSAEARKLAVLPGEETVLSVGFEGTLYLHHLGGDTEQIEIDGVGIEDIDVNASGTEALLGLVGGGGVLINLETEEITRIDDDESVDFQCAAFGPEGKMLYFGTEDGTLKAYNRQGHLMWAKKIHDGAAYDLDFSPSGDYLVSAGGDDRATIWKVSSLSMDTDLWTTVAWKDQSISRQDWESLLSMSGRTADEKAGTAFIQNIYDESGRSASRNALVEAIEGSLFYKLDGKKVKAKGGLKLYRAFPEGLNGIAWSDKDQTMIALGNEGHLFKLDADGGFEPAGPGIEGTEPRCFVPLPDGRWAVAQPGEVYILDEAFEVVEELEPTGSTIYDIAVSADGKYLAAASADYDIALIATDDYEMDAAYGHADEANAVAFFPNGSGFVSGADDNSIKFWDLNGNLKRSVDVGANIWALALSPDGERIAAGTNEGELMLIDKDGTEYKRWSSDSDSFWAITYAPDGETFAAGNNNGKISVWGKNGEAMFSFDTGEGSIFEVAYSPDGKYLFVATTESEVYRFLLEE